MFVMLLVIREMALDEVDLVIDYSAARRPSTSRLWEWIQRANAYLLKHGLYTASGITRQPETSVHGAAGVSQAGAGQA